MKTSAARFPQVTHLAMSRKGGLRKGDSTVENMNNVRGVAGDCLNEDTFPEEFPECDSLIHTVGTLIEGKSYDQSYKAMNRDTAITIAKKFNEAAKQQDRMKNFVFISSEKAPPFLGGYLSTKMEAEDYLLNSCPNLRVHIIRPGFVVNAQERSWSPILG
jgi:hypothetical protein